MLELEGAAMTLEIFLWIVGVGSVPAVTFAFSVYTSLKSIKKDTDKLLEMHYDPDNYGFGTEQQNKVIEDNTRAIEACKETMNALTYYIKWLAQKQFGETPPPHIGD